MHLKKKYILPFTLLVLLLIGVLFLNLFLGSVILPVKEIWLTLIGGTDSSSIANILFNYRIPKMLTALLAGVALSICGMEMQTLFRNPLADPYILGVSSGAGVGVALLIMGFSLFGISTDSVLLNSFGVVAAALAGAGAITFLMVLLSFRLRESNTLLIFGILISGVAGALIALMQYLSPAQELKTFVIWTMGSFSGLSYSSLLLLAIIVVAGVLLSIYNIKELNALLFGEEDAKTVGVDIERSRRRILITTTILAGGVTAFCGPIGFIGIVVPHIARYLFKESNHKVLLPATALIGAIVTVTADTISQLPGRGEVLPINTVSALLGIPIILIILLKSEKV